MVKKEDRQIVEQNQANFDLEQQLSTLPEKPGVYLMHSATDEVIYVGKARNLRNRVRNYFQPAQSMESKIFGILSQFAYFEVIVTHTEMEALILECNLIKKYMPRYNVLLKDDKSFPYIVATLASDYPKIYYTRQYADDKNLYLGPFVHVNRIHHVLQLVQGIFKLRQCNLKIEKLTKEDLENGKETKNKRACLNFYIGKCLAPCIGKVSFEAYNLEVRRAVDFLENRKNAQDTLIKELTKAMHAHGDKWEFEEAKDIRDTIKGIYMLREKQLLDKQAKNNQDIIGFYQIDDEVQLEIIEIREGKMLNREQFSLIGARGESPFTFIADFILQYYSEGAFIPNEIIIQSAIDDKELLETWLSHEKDRKVTITIPQRGDKVRLVQMAEKNARFAIENKTLLEQSKADKKEKIIDDLQGLLTLDFRPNRMEAYDISNTQGVHSVGSMVVYENTLPIRKDYRKFNIRTIEGPDDYGSMKEVIRRRFKRFLDKDPAFHTKPDILFIDGGIGHVHSAMEVLEELAILLPVVGMVKDDNHQTKGLFFEETEYPMDKQSDLYKFIARMQEEVHRFAIDFHRQQRSKGMVRSILDDIPGIGPKRRRSIITHFKDIEAVKEASVAALADIPSMNEQAAKAVVEFFQKN